MYPQLLSRVFSTSNTSKQLLKGYRVIDASRILVGSFCSLILADQGAEVIKIEMPKGGDETRKWGPPFKQDDSTYFMSINRNKKSVTVDLKKDLGIQIVHDLVKKSDIFIENFIPPKTKHLQIDYDTLKALNPSLIYASISGFPRTSPTWGSKAAFDFTIQALSGLMHCTGDPQGPPFKVGYAVTDILSGQTLLNGIMSAIIHRERTGQGQLVESSLLESTLYSMCYVQASQLIGGVDYMRMGNQHPNIAPYSTFKTKDQKYLVVGVATEPQFQKLSNIIGLIDEQGKFNTNNLRCQNRDELNRTIQDLMNNWNYEELIKEFTKQGVPFSEIHSVRSMFEIPQIKEMNLTQKVKSEKYKSDLEFVKYPVQLSKLENKEISEPPLLGEHNNEILREVCGYNEDKISQLKDQKVI